MNATVEAFRSTDPPADIADALRRDGTAVIHELVGPEVADAIAARITPALRAQEPARESFFGAPTRGLGNLFVHAPEVADHLLLNETFLEVADAILLPQAPMAASAGRSRPSGTWEEGLDAAFEDYLDLKPKGSAALWTGKTLHGLAASRDESRTSVTFVFMVDWLTTEENQFFAIPPEVARGLPERAQQLIGYRASPALGWVSGRDPENLLRSPDAPG